METIQTNGMAAAVREVATMVEREANVRAIFGEPMKLESRVVIPVARVAFGVGGGGVRTLGAAIDVFKRWLGRARQHTGPDRALVGGGGGGLEVRAVGFLCEENGRVVFTPIELHLPKKR